MCNKCLFFLFILWFYFRLDPIPDGNSTIQSQIDLKRLKDDFYVDILANTPALDTHSMISAAGPQGMEMFDLEK